jgi:ribosomal protein S18 acetylase RimI-like enzyme
MPRPNSHSPRFSALSDLPAALEVSPDSLRLPQKRVDHTDLTAQLLDHTNVAAAIEIGRRAFVYRGEHEALTFEFSQFAKGARNYIDPVEQKPVTLLDYRLLRLCGQPAAASGLYRFEDTPKGEVSIGWTAVHPDFQRLGVGSAMLTLLIELARQYGSEKLSVFSIDGDPYYEGASRLYTKGGFQKTDEVITFEFKLFKDVSVPITWRKFIRPV